MNPLNSPLGLLPKGIAFLALLILFAVPLAFGAPSSDEARVTRIVREVKLLPTGAKAKPANLNDQVDAKTGVRTGDRSRSELTFVDLTIERLGSNTVFHFDKAGRVVELDGGSMLLRVPKDSGGGQMQTRAVTVGITGTTLILETTSAGRNKLIVLEGGARLSLRKYPRESVNVRGGQMEDVPAGASKLPPPVNIDLNDVMKKHPLITDFPPLPSQDQIYSTMRNPPTSNEPGGPVIIPPILGGILAPTIGVGVGSSSGGGHHPHRQEPRNPRGTGKGQDGVGSTAPLKDANPNSYPGKPKPTATPSRKKKTG